ncbi:carbohydrate kinase [Glaciihabitans sp. dw_435]|uniref:carbohydrate kinase family protein n=1 Tax=Glaciihabitans sp. dw_435 TaxID=2720081 RepID=UPI001BD580A7|nr:carbohydrate kinase [Glaciihabitans sp. dw_435]
MTTTHDHTVLVVGESLVDVVSSGSLRDEHPGGSPLNVAFGLGRLGVETALLTEFGEDDHGALLASHLDSAHVTVLRPEGFARKTSTAEAVLQPDGSAEYWFDVEWTMPPLPEVPHAEFIHTGSIAAMREPGQHAVTQLFEEPPLRAILSYDPNVRPAVMGDRRAALQRVEHLAECAHIVKLSDDDAAWLYPGMSVNEVCDHILDLGVSLLAVTLGAQGAFLASGSARIQVPAVPVMVADTIGAGDAFMSALLYGLVRDELQTTVLTGTFDEHALRELARTSLTGASITVSRPGAMPPTRDELDSALLLQASRR